MSLKKVKGRLPEDQIPKTPANLLGIKEEITFACCQLGSEVGDVKANLERAIEIIKEAAKEGADLVAFPETYLSNYTAQFESRYLAEPVPGPSTDILSKIAKEHNIYIVMGMPVMVKKYPGFFTNGAAIIGPNEGVMGVYSKITLPTFRVGDLLVTEGNYFAPGTQLPLFDIRGWKMAVNICQDAWLPEIPRIQALQGAQVILTISAGPKEFQGGWHPLLKTRAAENRVFQCFANVVGTFRGITFFGGNTIITPDGVEIAGGILDEEAIIFGTMNIHTLYNARTQFPGLRPGYDLQPYFYEILTKPIVY